MARFGIDFDGVIHDWDHPLEGRRMGPPMDGAKEALTELLTAGHEILIHSCNNPKVIRDWMLYYQIPYTHIWTGEGKPVCDVYLDDRAVTFTSWDRFMEMLRAAKA